jgi:AcrR family transcriptional regulator
MDTSYLDFSTLILQLEQKGLVTRTFRRLDFGRQRVVVNAILEEAAESGPADINIKTVASRAGVSIGSLYQYFGSREGLLNFTIALVVDSTVELFNVSRPYLAAMPLREGLRAYLQGGVEWTQEQLGFARFFAAAAYRGKPELAGSVVDPIALVMRRMVADMVAAAVERGELRRDLDTEAVVGLLHTLLIAVGDSQLFPYLNHYYQLTGEDVSYERVVDTMLDMLEQGIGARNTV